MESSGYSKAATTAKQRLQKRHMKLPFGRARNKKNRGGGSSYRPPCTSAYLCRFAFDCLNVFWSLLTDNYLLTNTD